MSIKVSLKWGKEVVAVELDPSESIGVFKMQVYSLTRVPPEGQKIMVPRIGALREDATWDKYKPKDGAVWMLVGTAEDQMLQKPDVKTVFLEDADPTTVKVFKHKAGLENLGNTCYLNSSIQMLASVPELQKRLATYQPEGANEETRVVAALRRVVNDLDQRNQVVPYEFLTIFRDTFPQFAEQAEGGGFAQQDADECLSSLIRCLGNVSPLPQGDGAPSNIVAQLFSGTLHTSAKCVEDEAEVCAPEVTSFNKLPCHISNTTNYLHESLKESMEDQITKYSANLNRDAVYSKQTRIAKLPPYLCVQLIRFWWNDRAKVRAKISRPVDFPMRLDMFDYCTDELKERLAPVRKAMADRQLKATKAAADSSAMEVESQSAPLLLENETGMYELQAVVTHRGRVADSGHYVAWVKHPSGQWLLFDDDTVTPVPVEDIRSLTGAGGADWHIAYILLYASVPKPADLVVAAETESTATSTTSSSSSSSSTTGDAPQ